VGCAAPRNTTTFTSPIATSVTSTILIYKRIDTHFAIASFLANALKRIAHVLGLRDQ